MGDISSLLGISRVTLYRYFANRDQMAVEIHVRMLEKINSVLPAATNPPSVEDYRRGVRAILKNYANLQEAYRYIGMFDKIYLDNPANNTLTQWTIAQLTSGTLAEHATLSDNSQHQAYNSKLWVILSTFTWFLEKLALRGELTWSDKQTPLEEHIEFFEKIILRSFDLLEEE